MHLCAQEDHTCCFKIKKKKQTEGESPKANRPILAVASELFKHGADLNAQTNALYTPLHVACHFGYSDKVIIRHTIVKK